VVFGSLLFSYGTGNGAALHPLIYRVAAATCWGDNFKYAATRLSGSDGSYWLELRQSNAQSLVFFSTASEAAVLKYFQRLMPSGIVAPDVS
jgi:hypothetical protein